MCWLTRYSLTVATIMVAGVACASELGDAENGAEVFKQCQSCHEVGEGAKHRVGPHLNGVFGRPAGGMDGVKYSRSMRRAGDDGLIWTEETLHAFIENPKTMVSKTRMSFRGISDAEDRGDLLAYLRIFSDNPADIPEAEPTAHSDGPVLRAAVLALEGDPEWGEYLASECQTCHQVSGANDGIPGISGWPAEDFAVAMHAYKQKLRPHPVMQMMAGRLNDEEIAALAAYFKDLEE